METDSSTFTPLLLMGLPAILKHFTTSFYQSSSALLNNDQAPQPPRISEEKMRILITCASILFLLSSSSGSTLDLVFSGYCTALMIQLLDANDL